MKLGRVIISIFVVVVGVFIVISQNFNLIPYMLILLAIDSSVKGFIEINKDRKSFWGYFYIFATIFLIYVSMQTFMFQ